MNLPTGAAPFNNAVSTAIGNSLGVAATTNGTNFDALVSFSLVNGTNAGTVNLQAKSSAAKLLRGAMRTHTFRCGQNDYLERFESLGFVHRESGALNQGGRGFQVEGVVMHHAITKIFKAPLLQFF